MCGIAALINPAVGTADAIRGMLAAIRHRGPDDEGWVAFRAHELVPVIGGGTDTPDACFRSGRPDAPLADAVIPVDALLLIGHRRLSILDTSPAGHQPMCYGDSRYWIVFNGEIYNHVELRAELESMGHRFHSRSDTEAILAAYATWGADCLARLHGMFAFALVDRVARKLLLARDRFGIKPLYYWVSPQRSIAFASEIKQFTGLPLWKSRSNGQRGYDFLTWGILDHTDETLFAGVHQVPPGHCIEWSLDVDSAPEPTGMLACRAWYRLSWEPFAGSLREAGERFRELFTCAVRSHLRADVPVGSCLSGGLDSSAIVCAMNDRLVKAGGAQQHAFSACSHIKRFDEREYIEAVVRHTGVAPHYVYPELEHLLNQLSEITWYQDEPFGSTSIFAQWSVFDLAARNGVKVMLDGQGADEQLAGYQGYYGARYVSLFRQGCWIELLREINASRRIHGRGALWAAKYLADALLPEQVRSYARGLIGREILRPAWLDVDRLGAVPADPARMGRGAVSSVRELSYRQLTSSNLQMLLHWEDRDSMAHSIEARVPFLDHRLVEFVLGLPDEYKISGGITKRVMREGLVGVLPDEIRLRMSKLGFATPEEHWVRVVAPDRFRRLVNDAIDTADGLLLPAARQFAEAIITGRRPFDFTLWRMISYAAWLRRFEVATHA